MEALSGRDVLAGYPQPGMETLRNTIECLSLTAESTCVALPSKHLDQGLAEESWLDLSPGIGLPSFPKLQGNLRAQTQ